LQIWQSILPWLSSSSISWSSSDSKFSGAYAKPLGELTFDYSTKPFGELAAIEISSERFGGKLRFEITLTDS